MKKILLRCSALMVAAFVLLGSVLLAAPVKASAAEADSIIGLWTFNDVLIPPVDTDRIFVNITFDATYEDGSVLEHHYFCPYVSRGGGENDFVMKFYSWDFDNNTYVDSMPPDLYVYASDSWIDNRPVSVYLKEESSDAALIAWLNANATFQAPPPGPGPLVEVMTDLKEQNQLSQVLTQVVTMIPIGLGCLVGYKGLRKALDLLQRILHQA